MNGPRVENRSAGVAVLLTPVGVSLLSCLAGWEPTRKAGGSSALHAMLLAQATLLAVLYSTLLPIMRRMGRADSLDRFRLALRAAGERFVITLVVGGAIVWAGSVNRRVFLIWIAIGYVLMTMAGTLALVAWMRKTEKRKCT